MKVTLTVESGRKRKKKTSWLKALKFIRTKRFVYGVKDVAVMTVSLSAIASIQIAFGSFATIVAVTLVSLACGHVKLAKAHELLTAQFEESDRQRDNLIAHIAAYGNPTTMISARAKKRQAMKVAKIDLPKIENIENSYYGRL